MLNKFDFILHDDLYLIRIFTLASLAQSDDVPHESCNLLINSIVEKYTRKDVFVSQSH